MKMIRFNNNRLSLFVILAAIVLIIVGGLVASQPEKKTTEVKLPNVAAPIKKYDPPKLVSGEEVEAKLNEYRASQGLYPLRDSQTLDRAAQARAEKLCADNSFTHDLAWNILDKYYRYSYAGENLYYGDLLDEQANDAIKSWVASPSHLKNIVGQYTEFGIGVKQCNDYQGWSKTVIITNYFGVPR